MTLVTVFSTMVEALNAMLVGAKFGSSTLPEKVANPGNPPLESLATALMVTGRPTNKSLTSTFADTGNTGELIM